MPVARHASELQPGNVILGRYAGPLVITKFPVQCLYQGKTPAWRIAVEGLTGMHYRPLVTPGDPLMYIAEDPDDAWNEHAIVEKLPKLNR